MKFAILICTLDDRKHYLDRLLATIPEHPDVTILHETDNRKISTGAKRNILLKRAKEAGAEYVAFVDDDDGIMPEYVPEILKALEKNPDVVGFNGYMTTDGANPQEFKISKKFPYTMRDGIYLRYNNHLSPVRTNIALAIKYRNISFKEDYDYATRLRVSGLLKTEVYIDKTLYHYDYRRKKR